MAQAGPEQDLTRSTAPVDRFLVNSTDPAGRRQTVMSGTDIGRSLRRMAHEIIERCGDLQSLALIGICTRGAPLAQRLASTISAIEGVEPRVGQLDITMHRDDLAIRAPLRQISPSRIEFSLDRLTVILVDDVVFTGRSVRAALNALGSYGRPDRVQLAVLVDRGHRELPIRPDYVGKNLPTQHGDHVRVLISEADGADQVTVTAVDP